MIAREQARSRREERRKVRGVLQMRWGAPFIAFKVKFIINSHKKRLDEMSLISKN